MSSLPAAGGIPPILVALAAQASLLFLRIAPAVVFTPLFGGGALPARLRMAVAVALTLALLPAAGPPPPAPAAIESWIPPAASELLAGLGLALGVSFVLEMAAAAGVIADQAAGTLNTNAFVFDPLSRGKDSLLAAFHRQTLVALFCAAGGHLVLCSAVARGLEAVPLGRPFPGFAVPGESAAALAGLAGALFTHAVELSAPVLALFFVVDVGLGLIDRAAGRIQVWSISAAAKPAAALAVTLLLLAATAEDSVARILRAALGFGGG